MTRTMGDVSGDVDRATGGEFREKYSDDDVVAALAAAAPEPLAAAEVADEVGLARTTAHNRLGKLAEEGVVDTKKFGAKGRAYWLAE